jgi:hypothetical protein
MDHRLWQDVPICGWSILFHYRPREIMCRRHGRVQELIPWADAYARVTYRFEYVMLVYCQLMPQKAAAKILRVPKSNPLGPASPHRWVAARGAQDSES